MPSASKPSSRPSWAGNVHAQVTADVDFSIVEHTDESYKPNQTRPTRPCAASRPASRPRKARRRSAACPARCRTSRPGGHRPIATAQAQRPASLASPASGQPGQRPAAQQPASAATASTQSSGPSNSRRDTTTNYELDRSVRHVQQSPGGVRRLSVAVIVNYRQKTGANGKTVAEALPATQLKQIENLTKEAMGYSGDRGDSLNVVNSPFTQPRDETPELPLWKQPDMIELAKTLAGYLMLALLAMFLWFKVARPVLRKYTAPPLPAPAEPESGEAVLLPAEEQANPRPCASRPSTRAISPRCATPRSAIPARWPA